MLDTAAVFQIMEYRPLRDTARTALRMAEISRVTPAVVAISGRENCMVEKCGKTGLSIGGGGDAWFQDAIKVIGLTAISIDARIAMAPRCLHAPVLEDLGDLFIVATAKILVISSNTNDRDILAYVEQRNVCAIAC